MGLKDQLRALQSFDLTQATGRAIERNEEAILELNRAQMMAAQNTDGAEFKPFSTDPHFKGNTKAAAGYTRFKDSLGQPTPSGRPNFKINGQTHNEMTLEVQGSQVIISSRVPWTGRINAWQGGKIFGLTPANRERIWNERLQADVANQLQQALNRR